MIQNSKFLGIKIMCFEISMLGRFKEMLKVFSKFEICLLYKLFWVLGCFGHFCDILVLTLHKEIVDIKQLVSLAFKLFMYLKYIKLGNKYFNKIIKSK